MTNYEKSNSILEIPNLKISFQSKKAYDAFRNGSSITEKKLQDLASLICKDLGLRTTNVSFKGRRPYKDNGRRTTQETHGHYSPLSADIRVYAKTAKRQSPVAPKSAISTLLHELVHHIDTDMLKLKSVHTRGFYQRLKHLQESLK